MVEKSFKYQMPYGIPGATNRDSQNTIEAMPFGDTPPEYGAPVVISGGKAIAVSSADDVVYGLLVRPYPTHNQEAEAYLGVDRGEADVLVRGYMTIVSDGGTAKRGKPVYMDKSGKLSAKSAGTEINAVFMGAADGSGNVEIAYNI